MNDIFFVSNSKANSDFLSQFFLLFYLSDFPTLQSVFRFMSLVLVKAV